MSSCQANTIMSTHHQPTISAHHRTTNQAREPRRPRDLLPTTPLSTVAPVRERTEGDTKCTGGQLPLQRLKMQTTGGH
jgi:hypothetical protein